jgi:penicillin amidase
MEDAFFAIGFLHAQDRLWQLAMHQRIYAGRLAEIGGASALPTDTFLRTLSLKDRARKAWPHQSPKTRSGLNAYANGINSFIAQHEGALPPEFMLTGTRPESWTPIDSLGWLKVMALDLGGNFWMELARLDLAARLDSEQLAEFFPPYPGEAAHELPDISQLYEGLEISAAMSAPQEIGKPRGLGSNNWVISGALSKSGKPLLANDPHLGLTVPSLWYLAHLKIGDEDIIGATMPGLPFVVLGRNNRIAWGFTNVNPDVQDLYIEKLTGDGSTYLTPSGPQPFKTREEVILVKDAEPVTINVRETRHGPVISDARSDLAERLPKDAVIALAWTALDEDDTTASMGLDLTQARDFPDFLDALSYYIAPMQNIVYADVDGHIGYFAPGRVPVRLPENRTQGLMPAPGWLADYDWQGTLPYSELPRTYDPDAGVIATANEKITPPDYPHYLTSEWAMPYRGDRIRALIAETGPHDLDSMSRIQMDIHSSLAADLLPLMLDHATGGAHGDLLDALGQWNLEMAADRPEPLIFTAWHRALVKQIIADELGSRFPRYWSPKAAFLRAVLGGAPDGAANGARWCDDVGTTALESCAETVTMALDEAMKDLAQRLDRPQKSWRDWRWGDLHQVVQDHRPFSQVPFLAPFFERRAPAGGGTDTVNVAGPRFAADDPFTYGHGASYRVVYDLADLDRSRYVIPTGQSGIVFSKHYDDMMPLWLQGQSISIASDPGRDAIAATLILVPRSPKPPKS